MRVAVIGSRNLTVKDLGVYLPEDVTEIAHYPPTAENARAAQKALTPAQGSMLWLTASS